MVLQLDDPRVIEFDVRTDEMLVNMGPQHPSTHGVLRLVLRTDGEIVSEVEPHIGYLHRCAEKIGENLTPRQWVPSSSAIADTLCARRPQMVTFAPRSTRYFAVPAPIPEPPPVIKIDLSCRVSTSVPWQLLQYAVDHAAIDCEGLTCDVGSFLRSQKQRCVGDIVGRTYSS